ncbi:hypothetical protein H6P81_007783 [Aristolochia fimbriata]|uniref:Uncharacterized protein n=1 Tax=Aristolochia fimbriata TaxID=158543 RepID=A0AAV7F2D4_ARIFI|nr:hypothetical protein H6P81_007783 [Aristolochia fimbriata]
MDACIVKVQQRAKKEEYHSESDDVLDSQYHMRDVSALEKSYTEEVLSDEQFLPLRPPPRLQNAQYNCSNPSHRLIRSSSPSFRYGSLLLGFRLIKRKKNKDFDPFKTALERVQMEEEEQEEEDEKKGSSSWMHSFSYRFSALISEPAKIVPQKIVDSELPGTENSYYSQVDELQFELRIGDESFSDGEARQLKPPPRLQSANDGRSKSFSFRQYSGRFLGKIMYSRRNNSEVADPFMVALERVSREEASQGRSFRWGTELAASNNASKKKKEMGIVESRFNREKPLIEGTSSYCTWRAGIRGSGADERKRLQKRKDVGRRGFGYLLIQFHGFLK